MSGQNTQIHGIYTVSPSTRGNPKIRKTIPFSNKDYFTNLYKSRKLHHYFEDNALEHYDLENDIEKEIIYRISSGKGTGSL